MKIRFKLFFFFFLDFKLTQFQNYIFVLRNDNKLKIIFIILKEYLVL